MINYNYFRMKNGTFVTVRSWEIRQGRIGESTKITIELEAHGPICAADIFSGHAEPQEEPKVLDSSKAWLIDTSF